MAAAGSEANGSASAEAAVEIAAAAEASALPTALHDRSGADVADAPWFASGPVANWLSGARHALSELTSALSLNEPAVRESGRRSGEDAQSRRA